VNYYKVSQFHSKIGELIVETVKGIDDKNKKGSILWKAENFQFKYGLFCLKLMHF